MRNAVFHSNMAIKGGAAYNIADERDPAATAPRFVNVAFVANYAADRGGAFANDVWTASSCERCVFDGNACGGKGGGVYLDYSSSPAFTDARFERNYASDSGGALAVDGSSAPALTRVAIVNNTARDAGGGLYVGTYGVSHGSVPNMPTLTSCTIAGNTALWDGEDNVFIWANDRPHLVNTSIEGEWFRDAYMSAR